MKTTLAAILGGLLLAACAPSDEASMQGASAENTVAEADTPQAAGEGLPSAASLPAYAPLVLSLADIPAPAGEPVSLFNGEDLDDWEAWLGYPDPGQTYLAEHDDPIGRAGKGTIFSVVEEDGAPALRIDGETWGSLVHTGDYADYHLRLEYKWSGVRHAPRLDLPENNGLLYHSHGDHGAVFGTWMRSVEFEIMTGSTGMVVRVGDEVSATTEAAWDADIIAPHIRYMPGGAEVQVTGPTWNAENHTDAEKPVGEWNVLDLYVLGDRAIHVVNGVPVMEVWDLCDAGGDEGLCEPLTHGRIQLQSEGAETFFRNMVLTPIESLPVIEREQG